MYVITTGTQNIKVSPTYMSTFINFIASASLLLAEYTNVILL